LNSTNEIIGEIVNDLRASRRAGASASQLVNELVARDVDMMDVNKYFRETFGLGVNVSMMPPEMLDEHIGAQIDAKREQWQNAPPYPDLMRRRDREAFKAVARANGIVLIVCAADRAAGQYQIHGAYKQPSGVNAWTGNEGEKFRADLNRKMGSELVRSGPLDQWAQRLELAEDDPQRGPKPPVLFFLPDGSVDVRMNAKSMELFYRFLKIDWDELYPGAQ
jgi:hypothetical protein